MLSTMRLQAAIVVSASLFLSGSCSPRPTDPTPTATPATPAPSTSPSSPTSSCPVLTRWSSGIHNMTDSQNRAVSRPVVGGHVVVDSTPLFEGRACNAESDGCGGLSCEDPRGAEWQLLSGNARTEVREHGFQFRIGPLSAGTYGWRVCPLPDAMDGQGLAVRVGPSACSEGSFQVE